MSLLVWTIKQLMHSPKNGSICYNELHDIVMGEDSGKLATIAMETLKSMREYAGNHFASEEEHMQSIGYPNLENHKRIHDDFIKQLVRYQDEVRAGEIILNTNLMKVLEKWFIDHILNEDGKFRPFVAGNS